MLTGAPPFDAVTALDVMMAHVSKPPPPPSQFADVDSIFDEPILKMLEKQPDDRPQTLLSAYDSLATAATKILATNLDDKSLASPLLRETVLDRERTLPRVVELPKPRQAAPTPQPTRAARRSILIPTLVAALALSVGWGIVWRIAKPSRPGPSEKPIPTNAQAAQHVVPVAPAPAPSPQVLPSSVAITVNTQPPRAELFHKERLLGVAPGPIHLPRSEEQLLIVVKAAGYVPATVQLKPSMDQDIKVTLVVRAAKPAKAGVSRDLENPY
jgi:serine/threonine protein kinase